MVGSGNGTSGQSRPVRGGPAWLWPLDEFDDIPHGPVLAVKAVRFRLGGLAGGMCADLGVGAGVDYGVTIGLGGVHFFVLLLSFVFVFVSTTM